MARNSINALITEKSLSFISSTNASAIFDLVANDQVQHDIPLKNVCAKVAPQLSDEIDEIVGLLGISKRRFLECAFVDAVRSAKQIMAREGVFDAVDHMTGQTEKGGD